MGFYKDVIDFLEGLGEDHKEKATALAGQAKEQSNRFNELEKGEREAKAITDEIGDNKIADLLTAQKFMVDNGGADKIIDAMHSGDDAKAENERLKAEHLKAQEEYGQKNEKLQADLEKANLFREVTPQLTGIKPETVDALWKLEAGNFAKVGDAVTYKGRILSGDGIEQLKTDYPYFVNTPGGGGGDGSPQDQQYSPSNNDGGVPDNLFDS